MFKEGDVFIFGKNKKAVIVKVLDEKTGLYYCVYHQNAEKYVVSEFLYSQNTWAIANETGRVIKSSEWPQYTQKLK